MKYVIILLVIILWGIGPLFNKYIYRSGIKPLTSMLLNTSFYLLIIIILNLYNYKDLQEDFLKIDSYN